MPNNTRRHILYTQVHYYFKYFFSVYITTRPCKCNKSDNRGHRGKEQDTYLLHYIEIICLHLRDNLARNGLNVLHLFPRFVVMDEVDRETLAPKTARTT